MKLFNELPTILPFYTNLRNQNRFKENTKKNCDFNLLSPSNALLPFMLKLPKGSPKPTSFKLISENGVETDLSNNISKLKAIDFDDFAYCYYNGEKLTFKYEEIEQDLNLNGKYYIELLIDDIKYFSEVFLMSNEIKSESFSDKFVKFEFYDTKDIEPIRSRNNFKQIVYFDTFIHTSEPEVEEEAERDGNNNAIPTFSKLTIKQKIEILVPDFIKIALMTLQLHEEIFVFEQNKRSGKIDRIKINPTTEDGGAFSTVEVILETDILTKTQCENNKQATNANLWV